MNKLLKNEQASFTLEASLVMPIVTLSTILLLFLGLYVYQKVYVQQLARVVAERTASNWDNSYRDLKTGNFNPKETDGLYWRLTSDSVSDLFGFMVSNAPTTVQLPNSAWGSIHTAAGKLAKASTLIPAGLSGSATYTNHLVDRKVTISLQKPFHLPNLPFHWSGEDLVKAHGSSRVVEPVELMRLTDITRTYIPALKGRISPQAAKAALIEPNSGSFGGEDVKITSERQAASYLQSLVGGSKKILDTSSGKKRTIDALDANGVAHLAFFTYHDNDLRSDQMPKDIELLKQGTQVKGVVWHFFINEARGAFEPADKLRKELESKGIVVVIHN